MTLWTASELASYLNDWLAWANKEQLPPEGDWRTWIFLGGRGAGKTRAGAEWVSRLARYGGCRRIALIAPTFNDAREVMVEGASGLRALSVERPAYEPSRRRLVWANGAQAFCFSAEDPESLRGPQFDAAWGDEVCFWKYPEEALTTLSHGLRLGERPRFMITTTPRPIAPLKRLRAATDTRVSSSATWTNAANLSSDFLSALRDRWTGSAFDRQELYGELVEDFGGALWRRAEIERARQKERIAFDRVVVAVDPPASVGPKADACGIIAAGASGEGRERRAVVLADASAQGLTPTAWAERAATLARSVGADAIVAEGNNGGEMVRSMLRLAAPDMIVRIVHARDSKLARAGPIATLYDQGRVTHAATFAELEDEMCAFGAPDFRGSPDRVDALVWALTDLMLGGAGPRARIV